MVTTMMMMMMVVIALVWNNTIPFMIALRIILLLLPILLNTRADVTL